MVFDRFRARRRAAGQESRRLREDDLDVLLGTLALAMATWRQGGLLDPRVLVEQQPQLLEEESLERLHWLVLKAVAERNAEAMGHYDDAWSLLSLMRSLRTGAVRLPPGLDPETRPLRDSVGAFINAQSWIEGKRTVEEHPELLGDAADRLLGGLVAAYRRYGSPEAAEALGQRRALLRRCREVGVDAAFGQPADDGDTAEEALWDAVRQFFGATTVYEMDLTLRQRPALLSQAADALVGELAFDYRRQGRDQDADALEVRRVLLRRIREIGAEAAFTEFTRTWVHSTPVPEEEEWRKLLQRASQAQDRYTATHDVGALDEAVTAAEAALAYPGLSVVPAVLQLETVKMAGRERLLRFRATGRLDDLDRAIELHGRAAAEAPSPVLALAPLMDLGVCLQLHHDATGEPNDLDRAIEVHEQALAAASPGSKEQHELLDNLGVGLRLRHTSTGSLHNLDRAVEAHGEAVARAGPDARLLVLYLTNLSVALRLRYTFSRGLPDLNRAVETAEEAAARVEANGAPDASAGLGDTRSAVRNSLALALKARYDHTGDPRDLDRAITVLTEETARFGPDSPELHRLEGNLAACLSDRARRGGHAGDVDRAVELYEHAVARTPAGAPMRPASLAGLAIALQQRYAAGGRRRDLERAIAVYREAATEGVEANAEAGLGAATEWAAWAAERQAWQEAREAGRLGMRAADRLLRIQLFAEDKQVWLRMAAGVPALAGYALARTGDLEEAAVALERGRAVLLSETLARGQADLERLAGSGQGDLVESYRRSTRRIGELELGEVGAARTLLPAQRAETLREARAELDAAAAAIRQVDGYERFLEPPTFAEVGQAARAAPLVYLAATAVGGLALVVGAGPGVRAVWLPELTDETLHTTVAEHFRTYDRREREPDAWAAALDRTTGWLWQAAMGPLLAALAPARRAVLVPVGLLGVLPLHAAWTVDISRPSGRRYALDELLLTYAPNAQVLRAAGPAGPRQAGPDGLLAVEDPRPADAAPLPYAIPEVRAALAAFRRTRHLPGEHATREAVMAALAGAYPVVHFACHGAADPEQPLDSALLLAGNQRLTLRDLLSRQEPLRARLAVLSACETGLVGAELPDEVVGLPAGLLQAGVTGVIASLWSVTDASTMLLMRRFYELLGGDGLEPAEALRQAQQWVRDTPNGGKQAAFPDEPILAGPAGPASVKTFWADARGHAAPLYWAAFTYTGAA
jgi:CHAT domain-containing protein